MQAEPTVRTFFDEATSTATHVVACPVTRQAAIIDSVLDYDCKSGCTCTLSADRVIAHVQAAGLSVLWHLETHAHADHLSAAPYLKQRLGGCIGIGARICEVQDVVKKLFNAADMDTLGGTFDRLLEDDEVFSIGELQGRVLYTPGHTPACVTYVLGRHAFVGDTLFMPDYGTARCDFPGGDAAVLYRSIRRLLALPDETCLHLCHDYPPNGREARWETTVGQQRRENIHVRDGVDEQEFAELRRARDRTLGMPALLLPSIQVNVRGGHLPPVEENGIAYLKIPLNVF